MSTSEKFSRVSEVSAEKFYGPITAAQMKIEAILRKECIKNGESTPQLNQLLGPSRTWMIFRKQREALDCCLKRRNGLMCFVFEQSDGNRSFLVAHPRIFWAVDSLRLPKDRRSYEIIQEFSVSKLYFDVEFVVEFNPHSNGKRMLYNFLDIVNLNLKNHFNLTVTRNDILELNSSTCAKYSQHVIYQIHKTAFENNYAVGNFVKEICNEIKQASEIRKLGDCSKMQEICRKYDKTENNILEFFIQDRKGQTKLFVDDGVYTKNRHFRLLGSSKLHKNSPLYESSDNMYEPGMSSENRDCAMFLDSLVTYFSSEVNRVLEFRGYEKIPLNGDLKAANTKTVQVQEMKTSLYPEIDQFINSLIQPKGRIFRIFFFNVGPTLVYEIEGYRYCHNIKRQHKRNNIKLVVSLNRLVYYQKCYDPDCSHYRSKDLPLPDNIRFLFEDDNVLTDDPFLLEELTLSDADMILAAEKFDTDNTFVQENLGLSDAELCEVVNCVEDLFSIC